MVERELEIKNGQRTGNRHDDMESCYIQLIKCVCGEGYKIWVHDGFTLIFKVTFKNMCVCI